MPRLPVPGGDDGAWDSLLNDYLLVEHNNDGTHNNSLARTTDVPEIVRGTMVTALVAGENVMITPDDAADTITIAAKPGVGPLETLVSSWMPYSIDRTGATDVSAALTTFFADAAAIGVTARLTPGTYLAKDVVIPSNLTLNMQGATIQLPDNTDAWTLLYLNDVDNVTISGGVLDGNGVGQTTWNEHKHQLRVLDGRNVRFSRVEFRDSIGDGAYISRDDDTGGAAPYTASEDVWIEDCLFTGTNANRNGVSVICGTRIHVRNNTFLRMGRADMPGAIDLEPNNANEFLVDIDVSGNTIDAGQGAVTSQYGICLANHGAGATVSGVRVAGNTVTGKMTVGIYLLGHVTAVEQGVTAQGNIIHDLASTGMNRGVYAVNIDADVSGNSIDNIAGRSIEQVAGNLHCLGNRITRGSGESLFIGSGEGLYAENTIRNCVIGIFTASDNGDFVNNRITASSGMSYGVYLAAGAAGNRFLDNRISGASAANVATEGTTATDNTFRDNIGYAA